MLDIDTFTNGIAILQKCYKGFKLNVEEISTWYEIIKLDIDEDAFLKLIVKYCRSESAPTCPADLIRYGKKMLMDTTPAPTLVAHALIEAPRRMLLSEFMHSDPSSEQQKEYILSDLTAHYPWFRNSLVYTVVVALADDYFDVLVSAAWRNDTTEISILKTELKSAFSKKLDKTVSHSALSRDMLEREDQLLLK